jgi:hypothetical protein
MSSLQNQFTFSYAMSANQADYNPISAWAGRFAPYRCLVSVLFRATTAGVRLVLSSGTRAIQPRSPVQGGGTAGTTPSPLNTTPVQFVAEPGEEIQPLLTEVLGGTPTVDGIVSWEVVA